MQKIDKYQQNQKSTEYNKRRKEIHRRKIMLQKQYNFTQ